MILDRAPLGRDFRAHYGWAVQWSDAWASGVWYPRWMPLDAYGFGDPAFLYYPPLAHAAAAALGGGWTGLKALLLSSYLGMGLSGWLWARRLRISPSWSAALLMTAPFAALALHRLTAVAWFASIPLLLLLLYFTAYPRSGWADWRTALGTALLVSTHVLTGLTALICLPAMHRSAKDLARWGASAALGLGLAGVYLIPALGGMDLIQSDGWTGEPSLDWRNRFIFPIFTAGGGGSWTDPYHGWIPAIVAACCVVAWKAAPGGLSRRLLSAAAVGLFFASELSYPLWALIEPLQLMQFPFRFVLLASAAALVALAAAPARPAVVAAACLSIAAGVGITGYSAWSLARPVEEQMLRPDFYAGLPEYRPAGLRANHRPGQLQEVERACRAAARICATLDRGSSRQAWRIATELDADIALPVTDFPQWRLTVDGSAAERRVDPQDGLIRVRLEPGDHRVELEWVPSALERAGAAVSGMSLLLWGALLLGGRRIRRVGNLVASAF